MSRTAIPNTRRETPNSGRPTGNRMMVMQSTTATSRRTAATIHRRAPAKPRRILIATHSLRRHESSGSLRRPVTEGEHSRVVLVDPEDLHLASLGANWLGWVSAYDWFFEVADAAYGPIRAGDSRREAAAGASRVPGFRRSLARVSSGGHPASAPCRPAAVQPLS